MRGLPKKCYPRGKRRRISCDVREYADVVEFVSGGANKTGLHVSLGTSDRKLAPTRYNELVQRLEQARADAKSGIISPRSPSTRRSATTTSRCAATATAT